MVLFMIPLGSGSIVSDDGGSILGVNHFRESGSDNISFFGVDKKGTNFGFGGRGGHMAKYTGRVENGSIGGWWVLVCDCLGRSGQ
jgi:hypothetical protein